MSKIAPSDIHEKIAEKSSTYGIKVVMMGDGAVGKTCLVLRYTQNVFSPEYKQSIGASFAVKDLAIDKRQVKLVIWDIAGQPSFSQVRRHYYAGAHGALLVFDVTSPATFMSLYNWYKDFQRIVPDGFIVLVGNKVDLETERRVPTKAGEMLKDWWKVQYLETSAATADGVTKAFASLVKVAVKRAMTQDTIPRT